MLLLDDEAISNSRPCEMGMMPGPGEKFPARKTNDGNNLPICRW
jgi:hypothetical protein